MLKTDEADVLALLTRALRLVEKGPDQTLSMLLRRAIIRAEKQQRTMPVWALRLSPSGRPS